MTDVLALQGRSKESLQIVGLVNGSEGHRLYRGEKLLDVLNDGTVKESDVYVFDNLKSCLFPTAETAELRQAIEERLSAMPGPAMAVADLIGTFHKCKYEATMKQIEHKLALAYRWTVEQIRQIDIRTTFTVPEMSTPAQLHALQELLKKAGFRTAVPLTETEAAGAWRSYQLSRQGMLRAQLQHGSSRKESFKLMVVDAGGLTCNVIEYTCAGYITDGADVIIQPTGRRAGAVCGSDATITESCFQHAKDVCNTTYACYGGFAECVRRLGYRDQTVFRRVLAQDFESYKVRWERERQRPIVMSGKALDDPEAEPITIEVTITRDLVQSWFDAATERIFHVVEGVLSGDTSIMSLTGGFFRSTSAVPTFDFPVVQGAICRGIVHEQPTATHHFTLGMGQEEVYDPKHHRDLAHDSPLIIENPYTGEAYVEDRWFTLMAPGELASAKPGRSMETIPQEYQLARSNPCLRKQLYASHDLVNDHDPILMDGQLRPEIEKWGGMITKDIGVQDLLKYPTIEPKGRKGKGNVRKYRVWAWLKIHRNGSGALDMKLTWELAPPEWEPSDTGGVRRGDIAATRLADDTLHDSNFPSFHQRKRARTEGEAPTFGSDSPTSSRPEDVTQLPGRGSHSAPGNAEIALGPNHGSDDEIDHNEALDDDDYEGNVEGDPSSTLYQRKGRARKSQPWKGRPYDKRTTPRRGRPT
ncbi:hypothetical protein LTR36_010871 [Oleoguttula mirabilis]|uniref:Uncharacterized protein n=1 Tax=Oleoguttula mirabilis TaxID=1507867 RepID=A0AAV9J3R2_9PEZI|nr:hypothetical protein LTR36_010871 [Oleoguttula mirabilis]